MCLITATNSQRLNKEKKLSENKLLQAITHMENLPDSDKVGIKGKLYAQVTTRVVAFRKAYGDKGRITTKIHASTPNRVLIEAQVHIREGDVWHLISNDWAEEHRDDGPVNKKSATENCATSAIGRALAAAGLGGGEYASFDEVDYAINEKTGSSGKKQAAPVEAKPKAEPPAKKAEAKAASPVPPAVAEGDATASQAFKSDASVVIDNLAGCITAEEAKVVIDEYYAPIKTKYADRPDFEPFKEKVQTRIQQITANEGKAKGVPF